MVSATRPRPARSPPGSSSTIRVATWPGRRRRPLRARPGGDLQPDVVRDNDCRAALAGLEFGRDRRSVAAARIEAFAASRGCCLGWPGSARSSAAASSRARAAFLRGGRRLRSSSTQRHAQIARVPHGPRNAPSATSSTDRPGAGGPHRPAPNPPRSSAPSSRLRASAAGANRCCGAGARSRTFSGDRASRPRAHAGFSGHLPPRHSRLRGPRLLASVPPLAALCGRARRLQAPRGPERWRRGVSRGESSRASPRTRSRAPGVCSAGPTGGALIVRALADRRSARLRARLQPGASCESCGAERSRRTLALPRRVRAPRRRPCRSCRGTSGAQAGAVVSRLSAPPLPERFRSRHH